MDAAFSTLLKDLTSTHPGHSELLQILCSFLEANAVPGFIHVHSPISTRHTQQVIQILLERISSLDNCDCESGSFLYSCLNGIECLSYKLFYHRILRAILTQHKSKSKAKNEQEYIIPLEDIHQHTTDLDSFLRALRIVSRKSGASIIIILDRIEKLKESLPNLWTPLSRLDELAGIPLSVITLSQAAWFELRPLDGSAIHPLLINVKPYSKKDSISFLTTLFPSRSEPDASSTPYNPAFKPLYSHFISVVVNICSVFVIDELELGYIASACWFIFVQPILNQWKHDRQSLPSVPLPIPDEDVRIRLTKYFTPLIANALEMLYPRTCSISQWIRQNAFPEDVIMSDILQMSSTYQPKSAEGTTITTTTTKSQLLPTREFQIPHHIRSLTTIAKYILISAFLASHNPHKSDLKLLARSINDKGKRKKGGGAVKTRAVGLRGKAKVPQKLLGPMPFPHDRLVAIVGSLMEEHFVEQGYDDNNHDDLSSDEKDIEMAVGRVQVSATITELVNQGLLRRIAPEKIDLEAMTYKSTIDQSCAFALAREVGIGSLSNYMYDAEG